VSVRVLVADDQEMVRSGFVTILGAQPDLEVVGDVADGAAAVAMARDLRPDVVVMDVRMPTLDGIEATRQLAGPGVQDPVRVLVVTTFNLDEYVYEALRAGASGFLLKDAPPGELVEAVRIVHRGQRLLAPAVTHQLIGRFAERVAPPLRAGGSGLSPRELDVVRAVSEGLSNQEIADRLVVSPETVKTYVSRILAKLDLRDRVQIVVHAYRTGLVP
jgi:DNA-binding NarL/FixJ family response regulator